MAFWNRSKECQHVEVVRVQPGDVIVYTHSERLFAEEVQQVADDLSQIFPNNRCIVVDPPADIKIVRAEAVEATDGPH